MEVWVILLCKGLSPAKILAEHIGSMELPVTEQRIIVVMHFLSYMLRIFFLSPHCIKDVGGSYLVM